MTMPLIYPIGDTEACLYAAQILHNKGFSLVDHPTPEVTHLLMDVPGFLPNGKLKNGLDLDVLLSILPPNIVLVGGNIPASIKRKKMDLLTDPHYLAQNAMITAHCALQISSPLLKTTFADTAVLVLGWGRIGKCLATLLSRLGADVTVTARRPEEQAMANALGYRFLRSGEPLQGYGVIFNTVPELTLTAADLRFCPGCIKIDLASVPGIEGDDVIHARGLPGKYAPLSSGKLIADTYIRLYKEVMP